MTTSGPKAAASARAHRLQIEQLMQPDDPEALALVDGSDVIAGLTATRKSLPPRYFYDDLGSQLFEQICELDEYYLTRTEKAILAESAAQIAALAGESELVELGSGSAVKIRMLLDAWQEAGYGLHYLPIDVSAGILEASARDLLAAYPVLSVRGLVGTFELALARLGPPKLPNRTICFLGSTLGNLDRTQCDRLFAAVAAALAPGDHFLLGVDLHKDTPTLEAAYDDARGVTARFNCNMLAHLNHRFAGDFDLDGFEHLAFYNEAARQVEIYLVSRRAQRVHLAKLGLTVMFAPGERLLTEISRKFEARALGGDLARHGLAVVHTFSDPARRFAVLLCRRTSATGVE